MNVERGRGTRWWALGAISLGLLAVGLDGTVLSLALPTLAGALRASESQLQWFVTSYTLAVTAAMLPAGLLGDRYGRKRVLLGALLVFGFASGWVRAGDGACDVRRRQGPLSAPPARA
jgi:Arabinose efflux permease